MESTRATGFICHWLLTATLEKKEEKEKETDKIFQLRNITRASKN